MQETEARASSRKRNEINGTRPPTVSWTAPRVESGRGASYKFNHSSKFTKHSDVLMGIRRWCVYRNHLARPSRAKAGPFFSRAPLLLLGLQPDTLL